ncbi:hypothetical protein acdb102_47010 [Acidothermaceae bacterium B102]|nr:hypothetical protein acdb102_47010 [Acidothermaceae bacterium B102]
MDFTRSVDPHALPARIRIASLVLVYDAGCLHYARENGGVRDKILSDDPVLTIDTQAQVASLVTLLQVSAVTDGVCMCAGNASLEFLGADGQRLAVVGLHHGQSLRWSGWSGDAVLSDGARLVAWLAELGYSKPLDEVTRRQLRQAEGPSRQGGWTAAAPDCVRDLLLEMLSANPSSSANLVERISGRLAGAFPDPVDQCRVALAWFTAGTGACTGIPMCEDIVGTVVETFAIQTVLAALNAQPTSGAVWAGALRHIAGWKSRTDTELTHLPTAVWDNLLELAALGSDEDKLRRMEGKRARVHDWREDQ